MTIKVNRISNAPGVVAVADVVVGAVVGAVVGVVIGVVECGNLVVLFCRPYSVA